jgi:hypothetical protein
MHSGRLIVGALIVLALAVPGDLRGLTDQPLRKSSRTASQSFNELAASPFPDRFQRDAECGDADPRRSPSRTSV